MVQELLDKGGNAIRRVKCSEKAFGGGVFGEYTVFLARKMGKRAKILWVMLSKERKKTLKLIVIHGERVKKRFKTALIGGISCFLKGDIP